IEAEPASLSRRMQLLQAALPSDARVVLTTLPKQIETKLKATRLFHTENAYRLWRAPYQAILYQLGYVQLARRDPATEQELDRRYAIFRSDAPLPLALARNLHLQGRFEAKEGKPAARTLYLACRKPDREIDALSTNQFFRASIGMTDEA